VKKRILVLLTVALVMAAMMAASAAPVLAAAQPDPHANCTGADTSQYVSSSPDTGRGYGEAVKQTATAPDSTLGQDRSDVASSNCFTK
jgi:hypothetical protein